MPMISPPTSALAEHLFGHDTALARHAKDILTGNRLTVSNHATVLDVPYHAAQPTNELRMECINALMGVKHGAFGVEHIQLADGRWLSYINTGDAYNTTLVKLGQRFTISCWGDYVERFGTKQD